MRLSYPRPPTGSPAGCGLESGWPESRFCSGPVLIMLVGRGQNPQLLGADEESCLFPAVTLASASVGSGGDDITNSMWKSLAPSTSLGCVLGWWGQKMGHT